MDALNVAVIEDDPTTIAWYETFFAHTAFPTCYVTYISDVRQYRDEYRDTAFNLALVDYFLEEGTSLEIVRALKFTIPHCYVAMVSSLDDPDAILELVGAGIDGFLRKPLTRETLSSLLTTVFDSFAGRYASIFTQRHNRRRDDATDNERPEPANTPEIVYESEAMDRVVRMAQRAAPSDATVLVRGASGTGKELIARLIHASSARSGGPLVALNIAALPETLLESELFGHRKGAFTGATTDRKGRMADADGGSLFIDEVGDIPPHVQVKLLRAIQFKQYQQVGDNATRQSDVRIIAATSRDLEAMIADNRFREDLYYRLSVITLTIPPLSERRGDLVALVDHFLERTARLHGKSDLTIGHDALEILLGHDYPGNVRELENTIEHAVVMARGGEIRVGDLPDALVRVARARANLPLSEAPPDQPGGYDDRMQRFEFQLLREALDGTDGNQRAAARRLGISERRLRYRMNVLGIESRSDTAPLTP